MKSTGKEISERIKAIRKSFGWTQEELAERAGCSQQIIAYVEGGKNSPNVSTVEKIAKALGCELKILLEPPAKTGDTDI